MLLLGACSKVSRQKVPIPLGNVTGQGWQQNYMIFWTRELFLWLLNGLRRFYWLLKVCFLKLQTRWKYSSTTTSVARSRRGSNHSIAEIFDSSGLGWKVNLPMQKKLWSLHSRQMNATMSLKNCSENSRRKPGELIILAVFASSAKISNLEKFQIYFVIRNSSEKHCKS